MSTRRYGLLVMLPALGGFVGGAVSSWLFVGSPALAEKMPAKVIRAERFELVDGGGAVRAALAATSDGPSLGLLDENGKGRAGLSVRTDGPSLVLRDENGKDRAVLGVTDLTIPRTESIEKRPPSSIVLFNEEGDVLWSAP